jgi:hypothetical protein
VIGDLFGRHEDKEQVADLVALNAQKLVPSTADTQQDWYYWPRFMTDRWPLELTAGARNSLLIACVRVLLARERDYWNAGSPPLTTLYLALDDESLANSAGSALTKLLDVGFLDEVGFTLDEQQKARILSLANSAGNSDWFNRLLLNFETCTPEQLNVSVHTSPVSSDQPQTTNASHS